MSTVASSPPITPAPTVTPPIEPRTPASRGNGHLATTLASLAQGAFDALAAVVSFYLAYVTVCAYFDWDLGFFRALWSVLSREWKLGVIFGEPGDGFGPYFQILLFIPLIRVLTAWKLGIYQTEGEFDLAEDVVDTFRSVTIGTILIIVFIFCYRDAANVEGPYEHSVFFWDWGYFFCFALVGRLTSRGWLVQRRRRGYGLRPVIVIGNNVVAQTLRDEVQKHPEIGYRFVEQVVLPETAEEIEQTLRKVPELVRRHDVREVFIATTRLSQYQILSLLLAMGSRSRVTIKLLPDLLGCYPRKVGTTQLGNIPLLELFTEPISGTNRALKRGLDIAVSIVALLLLWPILLLAAIAIKLTSRGPVLFKQVRVGLDCRPFTFYKLRTMYDSADQTRHEEFMARVIREGGVVRPDGTVIYKEEDDPRITPVGRFLRRFSIDEIPQFYNVLRGDMSVVGPRPPIPYEVENYEDWQKMRLSAKPGITGVWQVSGRNAISFTEMVKMDITYMENWSLWGDIKIILRTIPVVLFGKNAR